MTDCADVNSMNIGEPALALLEDVINRLTNEPFEISLTVQVKSLVGEAVGEAVDATQEFETVEDVQTPTGDFHVIIPMAVTAQLKEGEWYEVWWIGVGFKKKALFLARYGGKSGCHA